MVDFARVPDTLNQDTWKPVASLNMLQLRAQLYQAVRAYFQSQGVLEVETPILSRAANTDPQINSLVLPGEQKYLQTSPEFAMKRLLASGCGPVFQICKSFRGGEMGKRHNVEFTLLEWYRPGFDYFQLMDEVGLLLKLLLGDRPVEQLSYRQAFLDKLGVDPHSVTIPELARMATRHTGYKTDNLGGETKDALLDLLMSHVIEPGLGKGKLTFVYHFPASQCALARIANDAQGVAVAQRFELYVEGMELANGYQELTDAKEQLHRFTRDLEKRHAAGLEKFPVDQCLIQALEKGLPECAGVALGIDRLLMLKSGTSDIKEVLAFPGNIA